MAVIQNRATEQGDVLIIKSEVPIIGLVALLDFLDDVDGETGSKYFSKQFRYSLDGINYTPFVELTQANLELIEINSSDTFYVEYRYKREGSDSTGSVDFNYVELEGQYLPQDVGNAWNESNFSTYLDYNGICTIGWSVAVLEKLYKQGILPKFIERNKSSLTSEDRDFIDFWRSITHYYGWYVCLARFYKTFYTDPDLLLEYLTQRGAFVCTDGDFDYEASLYLMNNFLDEIRQRGTIQVVKEKNNVFTFEINDSSMSGSVSDSITESDPLEVKQIDGEYLRLICYVRDLDDFIFNFNRNENIGWNIGNASPLYFGSQKFNDINKFWVDDITNLSDFYFWNDGDVDINNSSTSSSTSYALSQESTDALQISNVTSGLVEGIGRYREDLLIKVNPNIDYEITFIVKQSVKVNNITFGCYGYDVNLNQVSLLNCETVDDSNFFFERQRLNNLHYQLVRGIIYAHDRIQAFSLASSYNANQIVYSGSTYYKALRDVPEGTVLSDDEYWMLLDSAEKERLLKTNLHLGNNLQFKETIVKIMPYIVLDNTLGAGGELFIHSIKIAPLNLKYSTGFIQVPNILEIWNVNRNKQLSTSKIEENAKKYLFPYNVNAIWNWVEAPNIEAEIETNTKVLVDPETGIPVLDPETGGYIFILE